MNVLASPLHAIDRLWNTLDNTTIANVFGLGVTRGNPQQKDFELDPDTGFMLPHPLPKLPSGFQLWEYALAQARESVSLGLDESDSTVSKREASRKWREEVSSVSTFQAEP